MRVETCWITPNLHPHVSRALGPEPPTRGRISVLSRERVRSASRRHVRRRGNVRCCSVRNAGRPARCRRSSEANGWYEVLPDPPPEARPVDGRLVCDWAIVGAGACGLAAARRLAELRHQDTIALIDAARIGYGASGRNAGFMLNHNTHGAIKSLRHRATQLGAVHRRSRLPAPAGAAKPDSVPVERVGPALRRRGPCGQRSPGGSGPELRSARGRPLLGRAGAAARDARHRVLHAGDSRTWFRPGAAGGADARAGDHLAGQRARVRAQSGARRLVRATGAPDMSRRGRRCAQPDPGEQRVRGRDGNRPLACGADRDVRQPDSTARAGRSVPGSAARASSGCFPRTPTAAPCA